MLRQAVSSNRTARSPFRPEENTDKAAGHEKPHDKLSEYAHPPAGVDAELLSKLDEQESLLATILTQQEQFTETNRLLVNVIANNNQLVASSNSAFSTFQVLDPAVLFDLDLNHSFSLYFRKERLSQLQVALDNIPVVVQKSVDGVVKQSLPPPQTAPSFAASTTGFTWKMPDTTPSKPVVFGQPKATEEDEEGDENAEAEDANIQFKPVVPLPPKVEAVTGEEAEKVEWSNRAKLFRFTNNEWKERGTGTLKVLHDEQCNKFR